MPEIFKNEKKNKERNGVRRATVVEGSGSWGGHVRKNNRRESVSYKSIN